MVIDVTTELYTSNGILPCTRLPRESIRCNPYKWDYYVRKYFIRGVHSLRPKAHISGVCLVTFNYVTYNITSKWQAFLFQFLMCLDRMMYFLLNKFIFEIYLKIIFVSLVTKYFDSEIPYTVQQGGNNKSMTKGGGGGGYQYELMAIPVWISNYIHYKVRDEVVHPIPNFHFHSSAIEVREGMSNFITHLTGHVITYPCWD